MLQTIDLFGKLHSKCCEQDRAVSPLVMTIFPPAGLTQRTLHPLDWKKTSRY